MDHERSPNRRRDPQDIRTRLLHDLIEATKRGQEAAREFGIVIGVTTETVTYHCPYTRFAADPNPAWPNGAEDWRPLVDVTLMVEGRSTRVIGCLDSGADACLFPLECTHELGLDLSQMVRDRTHSLDGSAIETFYWDLTLSFFDGQVQYETRVAFADVIRCEGYSLLGFDGFFDRFEVRFEGHEHIFSVTYFPGR